MIQRQPPTYEQSSAPPSGTPKGTDEMTDDRIPSPTEVADLFDPDALRRICVADDFTPYGFTRTTLDPHPSGRERFYWYRDGGPGATVLAVAHLDTVQDDRTCQITDTASGLLATSGALDDRLGAYIISDLLPSLGIVCDVLLTTDEESGQSTASDYDPPKDYNWVIQFDRGGTDVVAYQYETPDLVAKVRESGARMGQGSYSDICELGHLGVAGLNWGTGYQDYHSPRSHAWLDDTFRCVSKFARFYRANQGTPIPHFLDPDTDDWTDYSHSTTTDTDYEVVADCGDWVDLSDERTFHEEYGTVICTKCATEYDVPDYERPY